MNDRIKIVRKSADLTQTEFAERLSLSANYVWMIETGQRDPGERTVRDICREFGVSEEWLRTGEGEMYAPRSRAEELTAAVYRLMADAPDRFKAALVSALLKFDPDGREWQVLEDIYNSVAAEQKKKA